MGKEGVQATPNEPIGPRETLLDFFKKNFMYTEKSVAQIKKAIGCFNIVKYKKGEDILKQGDVGDSVMIVVKGVVELYTEDENGQKKTNQRLGAHEIFGEYSFVSGKHVLSQSVSAREICTLLVLKRDKYEAVKNASYMEPIRTRVAYSRKLLLRQSLRKLPFLADVTEEQLADIDEYFKFEEFPRGTTLFHEGDIGDKFYVLVAGTVVVTTRDDMGFVIEVARLRPVSSFGEQALITDDERNATITTLEDCQTYTLSKKEFALFLRKSPEARTQLDNTVQANRAGSYFSDRVPIFQSMTTRHRHLLGVVANLIEMEPETVIKEEGTHLNPNFYLIVSGVCNVYVGDEFIKKLKRGDYFGEIALVSNAPSTATVKVGSEPGGATLMSVAKDDFISIFADEQAFLSELKIRLDGEHCSLEDILKHPKGRESFLKHCQQEYAKENVDFWQDVLALENIQRRKVRKSVLNAMKVSIDGVKTRKAELLRKRAREIYHKYLEPNSPEEVNLPAEVKANLIKRYDEENFVWDMFEEARISIYEMIEADNFQRYKASDAFENLIRIIGTYKRSSVTRQDSGNIRSLSVANTLE